MAQAYMTVGVQEVIYCGCFVGDSRQIYGYERVSGRMVIFIIHVTDVRKAMRVRHRSLVEVVYIEARKMFKLNVSCRPVETLSGLSALKMSCQNSEVNWLTGSLQTNFNQLSRRTFGMGPPCPKHHYSPIPVQEKDRAGPMTRRAAACGADGAGGRDGPWPWRRHVARGTWRDCRCWSTQAPQPKSWTVQMTAAAACRCCRA